MANSPLAGCGNIDSPYKIRQLMRRVITHQFKGEISTASQSAINGSASVALKTFEVGDLEDKLKELEAKLDIALSRKGKKMKKQISAIP